MTPRILIAGGCHVVGYPIGEQYSFTAIMRDLLAVQGMAVESSSVSHLPIKHLTRLMDAVDAFAPDVVVLQLGNYETNITFRNRLLKALGRKPHNGSDAHESLSGSLQYRGTWLWRLKCVLKLVLDTLLGHPLVDSGAIRCDLRTIFDALAQDGRRQVIVMGPLPCADPLYMRYRHRLAPVFEEEARRCNFVYTPIMESVAPPDYADWFVDATHLNGAGQTRLAEILAGALLGLFARRVPTDTEQEGIYADV